MFFSAGHQWIECARETKCLTKKKLLHDKYGLSSAKEFDEQGNLLVQYKTKQSYDSK